MKYCVICKGMRPSGAFDANTRRPGGLNGSCRQCVDRVRQWKARNKDRARAWQADYVSSGRAAAQALAWANANRDRKREIGRQDHRRHRDERLAKSRARQPEKSAYRKAWLASHPGYDYENVKRWRATYPDRAKVTEARKHAKRKGAPGELTAREWKAILLFYGHACALCRTSSQVRPLTIDHHHPIAKGGAHEWTNVWPLCMPCNAKKHTTVLGALPPHVAVFQQTGILKEASA